MRPPFGTFDLRRRLLVGAAAFAIAALPHYGALIVHPAADRDLIAGTRCLADDLPAAPARPNIAMVKNEAPWQLVRVRFDRRERGDKAPLVIRPALPGDLDEMTSVEERKAAFVSVVLPVIEGVNREILDRRRLVEAVIACQSEGRTIGSALREEIRRLHQTYRTDGDMATLHNRLDIVPPSLAVAQAAIESGWGTSRFAVNGNALFGQRTTNRDHGMRPTHLPESTSVRVAAFDHLTASVISYVRNLNTHGAYREFRSRRAEFRRNGESPDGLALAATLTAYSSRGQAYVRQVKSVIRANRLMDFDSLAAATSTRARKPGSDI